MILIVESGATKTDWRVVSPYREPFMVKTAGMNLASVSDVAVESAAHEAVEALSSAGIAGMVDEIHFYAAGLIPTGREEPVPSQAAGLDKVLRTVFTDAVIEYTSDTMAAARSVCGHKPGVAAILGTGSNSCLFDGERIVKNVRSGGFILGDEGGATRLGKLFMSDFLKGLVPEPVSGEFERDFEVDYMTVVRNVYKGDAPSGYLGSFAPWILESYSSSEYVRKLVESNFRDFFERALLQYDVASHPVGVVGGFGYACREILKSVAAPYGIRFGSIIPAPMEGLVDYHLGRI
ncbi:MAG: hypothetical protein IJ205_06995 [Bacteroidales bacterium]|nr:hypothetical protein [Bacteroidales bacterium]